jgi:hypothetical protein
MATKQKAPAREPPSIPANVMDELVAGPMTPESVQDLSMAFKKALIERALGAEMVHHLGYAAGTDPPQDTTNHRNGTSGKTVNRRWAAASRYPARRAPQSRHIEGASAAPCKHASRKAPTTAQGGRRGRAVRDLLTADASATKGQDNSRCQRP